MKHNLSFNYINGVQFLEIEFVSEGKVQNKITSVIYDGYRLDISDLKAYNRPLFINILARMCRVSFEHWKEHNYDHREYDNIAVADYDQDLQIVIVQ